MKQEFSKEFQTEMMLDNVKNSPDLYAEFLVDNKDIQEKFREFCREKGFVYLKKELKDLINTSGVAAHSEYSAEHLTDIASDAIINEINKPIAKELTNFRITKDNVLNCIDMQWHPHENYSFYYCEEIYDLIRLDNGKFQFKKQHNTKYLFKEHSTIIEALQEALHYVNEIVFDHIEPKVVKCTPKPKILTIDKNNIECFDFGDDLIYSFIYKDYEYKLQKDCKYYQFITENGVYTNWRFGRHESIYEAVKQAISHIGRVTYKHKTVRCKAKYTNCFVTRHNLNEFAHAEFDSNTTYSFYDYRSGLTYRLIKKGGHCFFCCMTGMPFSDMRHSTVYWALEEALETVGFIELNKTY